MSTGTSIEWTEATLVRNDCKPKNTLKVWVHSLNRRNPIIESEVSFSAVATNAAGNHVPWLGLASSAYRVDVIPCSRFLSAISALTIERFKQVLLREDRDRTNSTLPRMRPLFAIHSKSLIGCVSLALAFCMATSASPSSDSEIREPLAASPAPRETEQAHLRSFNVRGTRRLADRTALPAHVFQSVPTRSVPSELVQREIPFAP